MMKNKKLIRGSVLAVLLLLALLLAVGCSETGKPSGTDAGTTAGVTDGGETTGGEQIPTDLERIDVSKYALLVSDRSDAKTNSAAAKLMIAVADKLGAEFRTTGTDFAASASQIDPNAFEILVGPTNRTESTAALEALDGGLGYVVSKIGNKIVINASSTSLLDEAVQYFITTYVNGGSAGGFDIPKELHFVNSGAGGISLLDENGRFVYDIVYSENADTTKGSDQYDRVDYVILYTEQLVFGDTANNVKGLSQHFSDSTINLKDDGAPAKESNREILVGRTNRPETETFLRTLKVNEYGYGVVGSKLVIAGWSDYTTRLAIEQFIADVGKYVVDNGGVKSLVLLEANRTVKAYETWNADLPLYDKGELDGVVQLLNDSYEAYYVNTTAEEYKAYCTALKNGGYKKHQENQIGKNLYGTYYNDTTMIHVYYVDYLKAVRFITESLSTAVLPQNEDSYDKVTETTFTMMGLDDAAGIFGNCFIITLEDGSFILHDGGGDLSQNVSAQRPANNERDELYRLLTELNCRRDGKIVIAAWIVSHQHWDHFKNGYDMVMEYYRKNVVVEKMVFNIAAESVKYNSRNPGNYLEKGYIANVKMATGCDVVVMHTGQTMQIRNIKIEAMYTADDLYPDAIEKFNNSSFVHRFRIGTGKDKQSLMIVGDIEEVASKILVKMYGSELKTDIVQVAHHGYGGSVELYALFKPSVVLWPKDQKVVDSQLKGSGYYPTINQSLCNQPNVVLLVVADNGHKTIPLPLIGLSENRIANHNKFVTVIPRFDGF